ncbi:hypothetical protein P8452_47952 [Trifolium repens]|nr:hypothetical protein P8452_47952 [Trifolium repens]
MSFAVRSVRSMSFAVRSVSFPVRSAVPYIPTRCETDDDCPAVFVPLLKNMLPSVYKCIENICQAVYVKTED